MVNFAFRADPNRHGCELQVVHSKLLLLRQGGGGHADYPPWTSIALGGSSKGLSTPR